VELAKEGSSSVSLGDAVSGIWASIKLSDFGIASLKPKRTAAGSILYEIPSQDSDVKAELAKALKFLLEPKGMQVTRPVKFAKPRDRAGSFRHLRGSWGRNCCGRGLLRERGCSW